jgi:hypothetical protein
MVVLRDNIIVIVAGVAVALSTVCGALVGARVVPWLVRIVTITVTTTVTGFVVDFHTRFIWPYTGWPLLETCFIAANLLAWVVFLPVICHDNMRQAKHTLLIPRVCAALGVLYTAFGAFTSWYASLGMILPDAKNRAIVSLMGRVVIHGWGFFLITYYVGRAVVLSTD